MQYIFLQHKRFFICLATLFLLVQLTGCAKEKWRTAFGMGKQPAESAEALIMKGMDKYSQGKYDKAKQYFESLLS